MSLSTHTGSIQDNHLLAALTAQERARWFADFEYVEMPSAWTMSQANQTMTHIYFPTTAVVSLLHVMDSGAAAEIAVVGNEGAVGVSLFMGGGSATSRAVVQSAGYGYRLPAKALRAEFERGGHVMRLLLRYTQALIA
jgi:hypothetical protein